MPALSKAVSLPSSHRAERGKRKPEGGDPADVAAREADEENDAVAVRVRVQGVQAERKGRAAEEAGRPRGSVAKALVTAIIAVPEGGKERLKAQKVVMIIR